MTFSIKVNKEPYTNDCYVAFINPFLHDAGKVGTPGMVQYGINKDAAYCKLKERLISKGHVIIEE